MAATTVLTAGFVTVGRAHVNETLRALATGGLSLAFTT